MTWKCSKCSFRTKSFSVMQRHWSQKHSTAKHKETKGSSKKVYVYRPPKPPRR